MINNTKKIVAGKELVLYREKIVAKVVVKAPLVKLDTEGKPKKARLD